MRFSQMPHALISLYTAADMSDVSVMPGKKGPLISFSQSEENIMEALEADCSQFHTHQRAFMRL